MKVLIAGATGLVGKRLCAALSARGDSFVALSRDANKARAALPQAAAVFAWDPLAAPAPKEAFAGVDGVVNLLGETVGQKWSADTKKKIRDSRVLGTRNLVAAMAQLEAKPKVLVGGSAIGFYGNRGDEQLTEDAASGSDFLAEICKEWEAETARAAESGLRVVLLRTGVVLDKRGGALQQMWLPFKLCLGGPLGSGKQWFSWIHHADEAGLILHALDNTSVTGPLNAAAPNPVTNGDFARALGAALHRPAFLPTPVFAMRLKFGEFTDAALLASQRVIPKKAQVTGYAFKFPRLADALKEIVAT